MATVTVTQTGRAGKWRVVSDLALAAKLALGDQNGAQRPSRRPRAHPLTYGVVQCSAAGMMRARATRCAV